MKKSFFAAAAALVVAASVQAQSTVDSIAAKYKLLPMPGALTMEQKFPVIGNYQLQNSTEGTGTVSITLDSANKGIVWVEGLPQGKVKAYLKKSPSTYRILSQKTASGKQIQEGTLHYDTTTHNLHVVLGKAYDETDPTAIFASAPDMSTGMSTTGESETTIKSGDTKMKTEVDGNKVKTKTKTATSKNKTKVQFYTATKVMPDNMMNDIQQMQQSDSTQQQSDSTHQQQ